jgi:hypothetical protein
MIGLYGFMIFKHKALFFFLSGFLLFPLFSSAQGGASQIYFTLDDLSVENRDEYQAIKNYLNDKPFNVTRQFYLSAKEGTLEDAIGFENQLDQFSRTLSESIASMRKPKKIVEHIRDQIQKRFLKEFVYKSSFYEIDKNGAYNCVTATALFGVLLEKLKVPFVIKELPTHVYIIVYPDEEPVTLEFTGPGMEYTIYTQAFKDKYIQLIQREKLITEIQVKNQNVNDLFEKYFYASGNISLQQLAGMHYFNVAGYYYEKEDFSASFKKMTIANILYPGYRTAQMSYFVLAELIDRTKYSSMQDIVYLETISRFAGFYKEDELFGEFDKFTEQVVFAKPDPKLYDTACDFLENKVTNGAFRDHIKMTRDLNTGRRYALSGDYSRALPYLKKAYRRDTGNLNVQSLYIGCLLDNVEQYEIEKQIQMLITSVDEDSSLLRHRVFRKNYLIALAGSVMLSFEDQNITRAEKYLRAFENLYLSDTSIAVSNNIVGDVYIEASAYYNRKNNRPKAKECVKRGLALFPDNERLKERLKTLN